MTMVLKYLFDYLSLLIIMFPQRELHHQAGPWFCFFEIWSTTHGYTTDQSRLVMTKRCSRTHELPLLVSNSRPT
ncbi:unnamed protein product [Brassica oleracea var. botrytis]|uniref:(rape) hypothetical protein n=1 Tax=Brassica napus TaxID=3708 RepID=A0A816QAN6_BRANA|nr:unnamed protein product [Brassica napus]